MLQDRISYKIQIERLEGMNAKPFADGQEALFVT